MGQLRNGNGVTINEITVSHRALANSPHDACTFDAGAGIRGVNIGGKLWAASEDTAIRSVNVTFDGVSVDCNADFLLMLSDEAFRAEFVASCKAERARAELAESVPHAWEKRPEKDAETPGLLHWQCFKCTKWVAIKVTKDDGSVDPEAIEQTEQLDAGNGPLGCEGVPPAPEEMPSTPAVEAALGNLAVDKANAEKKAKRAKKGRN